MKTLNIIPALLALFLFAVAQVTSANDGKYIEAMQKNIQVVYTAASIAELQQAVNTFERISAAEKNKWEPLYYSAFGYIMMANKEQDAAKKDAYLDQAMTAVTKAKELVPQESEVVTLEGFIYTIRVTVDPATRGPEYAPKAMQTYGKATALNPENPRALVLMARMQHGTAQFFGSPITEACATADKALEKFANFKSDNPLAPRWGKGMAEELKKKCS
jgi:tetratricopeptide (TPR) repeat protein